MDISFKLRRMRIRQGRHPETGEVVGEEQAMQNAKTLEKAYQYSGPMTVSDITLASWNSFFREGGQLNQPTWLQSNRRKELEKQFVMLSRLHEKV